MIHAIATELTAALAAQDCPLKVIDGPEPTKATTHARERIVIEENDDADDSFGPIRTPQKNPRARVLVKVPAKITIYAQAVGASTAQWEHRRRARRILDVVLVALDDVLRTRKQPYELGRGRFVPLADQEASSVPAGAVYELTLSIERNVFEKTWEGDKKPEATLGGVDGVVISNTVRAAHSGSDTYETVIEG